MFYENLENKFNLKDLENTLEKCFKEKATQFDSTDDSYEEKSWKIITDFERIKLRQNTNFSALTKLRRRECLWIIRDIFSFLHEKWNSQSDFNEIILFMNHVSDFSATSVI